jgi:hypothetical protein
MTRSISEDQLLTLEHAAEIFLGSRKHVSTLRAEIQRGNLAVSKIGRSYWTTLGRLKQMDAKCLVEVQVQGSGSIKREAVGRSSTDDGASAQAALLKNLDGLRSSSGNTSLESTQYATARRHTWRTSSRPTRQST